MKKRCGKNWMRAPWMWNEKKSSWMVDQCFDWLLWELTRDERNVSSEYDYLSSLHDLRPPFWRLPTPRVYTCQSLLLVLTFFPLSSYPSVQRNGRFLCAAYGIENLCQFQSTEPELSRRCKSRGQQSLATINHQSKLCSCVVTGWTRVSALV